MTPYRGRIAPSPTGYLHLGHARTFSIASQRARSAAGPLVFRTEDLDRARCKPEFAAAMYEDLRWLGLDWQEGPDVGGPFAPYSQSERYRNYLDVWRNLRDAGVIYPCACSRKDMERALAAPHEDDDELPYPGTCRTKLPEAAGWESPAGISWRFKVPDNEVIRFDDLHFGPQQFTAGRDFSDFLVWRRDDIPAYQLAVVADDQAMRITEVVRGADLLKSTARQLLLIRALGYAGLGYAEPDYFHCELVRDAAGTRLAKRHDALSIRHLRESGMTAEKVLEMAGWP